MKTRWCSLCLLLAAVSAHAAASTQLSLRPAPGMTRADLFHVDTVRNPTAVLVLAPGCNGNGAGLVADPVWQSFARQNHLGLVGIAFASEPQDLHNGKGYYYAGNGSGTLLLQGLNTIFGRELPVLLYGFSGGAHFVSRFVEWKPERIVAWCAYSAGWWDEPKPAGIVPPGIVACGESDERLGASLIYFKQGRAAGKPWLWIGLPHGGHSPDTRIEAFTRDYFAVILESRKNAGLAKLGIWIDIDQRVAADNNMAERYPTVTAWLPDAALLANWRSLNEP